ncbi:MAG: metalloregulator ArsR/SmtB family transcription factor [Phycisphaera sp.]|nr:metalloregulator ArsR/SmtB family transcription factor [Phycisphaera sp.]
MVKNAPVIRSVVSWMSVLSDPTRLRLLRLLERRELGVGDLCGVLQMPQSSVSRHLKVLESQGWVRHRREGTSHLYGMAEDALDNGAKRFWHLTREQSADWSTFDQDRLRLERRLRDRQENSRAFFAGAAGQWDKMRSELFGSSFSMAAMLALLPDAMTVADLGCGTGLTTAELAPYVLRVIGIDQSQPMLSAARSRTRRLGNIELKKGDLEALPLDDDSCDAALLLLVLGYVQDPVVVLTEAKRIVKEGGRVVVVDLLPHDRDDFRSLSGQQGMGFEPTRLTELFRDAGLRDITTRPLPPQPDTKGPALQLAVGKSPNS